MAAVKEAFDLGINFFDTSPYYGDTKSETVGGCCGAAGGSPVPGGEEERWRRWQQGGH